jgi:hypothetical protein
MATSVEFSATSDYNTAGKQFIGRVTGPHSKWGTELEFVGRKSGKRGDITTVTVIDPGLYKRRNTTRKGTVDNYLLIWDLSGRLIRTEISEADALRLARDLTPAAIGALGRLVEAADLEECLSAAEGKDPAEKINLATYLAEELGLPAGYVSRGEVVAARRRLLDDVRGVRTPELPIEIDAVPSDPVHRRARLEADRRAALDRLAEIDLEIRRLGDADAPATHGGRRSVSVMVSAHALGAGRHDCSIEGSQIRLTGQEWVGLQALDFGVTGHERCVVTIPAQGSETIEIELTGESVRDWPVRASGER